MKYNIDPDALYTATEEAPEAIRASSTAMKKGRITGLIYGRTAPPFIKLGNSPNAKILYKGQALIDYLDQFDERRITAPEQLGGT